MVEARSVALCGRQQSVGRVSEWGFGRPDEDRRLRSDWPVLSLCRARTHRQQRHRDAAPRWLHADQRCSGRARRRQPGRRARLGLRTDRGGPHPDPDPNGHDLPQPQSEPRHGCQWRHPDRGGHAWQPGPAPAGPHVIDATQRDVRRRRSLVPDALLRIFRDRPVVPLLVLLGVLIIAFVALNPRANLPDWVAATFRAAIPLAILAGCQTLAMLTGGIDLSVAAVASMAGFVAASLLAGPGLGAGVAVAIAIAVLIGVTNGIGVGVFRVHPLIMTLGMGLVILGAANAYQLMTVR